MRKQKEESGAYSQAERRLQSSGFVFRWRKGKSNGSRRCTSGKPQRQVNKLQQQSRPWDSIL